MPQEPTQADTQDTSDHNCIFRMAGIGAEACQKRLFVTENVAIPFFSSDAVHEAVKQDTPVMIVYKAAVPFLTQAMQDGQAPSAALATWQAAATDILAAKKRARRKILLIEENTLLQDGADTSSLETVAQWLGLDTLAPPAPSEEAAKPDPLLFALAAQFLTRSPQAQQQEQDLEASALPKLAEADVDPDGDAGFKRYTQMHAVAAQLAQAQQETEAQKAEAQNEQNLLQAHIKELQAEMQAHVSRHQKDLAEQAQRTKDLETKHQAAQATATSLDAERNLLLSHMAELQFEISGHTKSAEDFRQQLKKAEGLKSAHDKALTQVRTLTSEAGALQKQLDAAQKQKTDLAAQLKAAQTGKATAEKETATLQGAHDKALTQVRTLTSEAGALQKQLDAAQKQKTDLAAQLKTAQTGKAAAEKDVAKLTADAQKLSGRMASLEKESATVKAESDLVMRHLREVQKEADLYHRRVTEEAKRSTDLQNAQTREIGENTERYQALRREIAQKLDAIGQNTLSQIAQLQDRFSEQESRLNATVAERGELALQVENLQHEIQVSQVHWAGQLQQAKQYEQLLTEKLDGMHTEYDKLLASKSWKVTKPLRTANMIVGQPKKKDT